MLGSKIDGRKGLYASSRTYTAYRGLNSLIDGKTRSTLLQVRSEVCKSTLTRNVTMQRRQISGNEFKTDHRHFDRVKLRRSSAALRTR
jgi:hypothetical protein